MHFQNFSLISTLGGLENQKIKLSACDILIYHFNKQASVDKECRLFCGTDGVSDGEQKRDFIYVDDCVKINLWFMQNNKSGIFNAGSGHARQFNDIANNVAKWHLNNRNTLVDIKYIDFPENLIGAYQNFTEASLDNLRSAGYVEEFIQIEDGIRDYLDKINNANYRT